VTNSKIFAEILGNRNEIKPSEEKILKTIERTENRVTKIEEENKFLRERIEFLEEQSKKKNTLANLLKDTGVSICRDLTVGERTDLKILRKYLNSNRNVPNTKSSIKGKLLYVNEDWFSAEDLRRLGSTEIPIEESDRKVSSDLSAGNGAQIKAGDSGIHSMRETRKNNRSDEVYLLKLNQTRCSKQKLLVRAFK
ncbi:hypothetical protein HHI36_013297, partial [Cryptolaemus montrouzieri]